MSTQRPDDFHHWLRAQLDAKGISQRQLAHRSGIDHSTISRLIRGGRMPSLETAHRLVEALRAVSDSDLPDYLRVIPLAEAGLAVPVPAAPPALAGAPAGPDGSPTGPDGSPTLQVERALRSDPALDADDVRSLLELYLALRRGTESAAEAAPPDTARPRREPELRALPAVERATRRSSDDRSRGAGLPVRAGYARPAVLAARPPAQSVAPAVAFVVRSVPAAGDRLVGHPAGARGYARADRRGAV